MHEIVCPHCEKAFKVDESGYAEILKQVHDKDFKKQLDERIEALEQKNNLAKENAVLKATSDLEKERLRLLASLASAETEKRLAVVTALNEVKEDKKTAEANLKQQYETQLREREETIKDLRNLKVRLSTKMVGETLEQHCETEFNRIRSAAFSRAYFEKDNDARSGSKGDYIFRDFDESGIEITSIMFEMKNESDGTRVSRILCKRSCC